MRLYCNAFKCSITTKINIHMLKKIPHFFLICATIIFMVALLWLYSEPVYEGIVKYSVASRGLHKAAISAKPSLDASALVKKTYPKYVDIPLKYMKMIVKWFSFQKEDELKEWEEKVFKGKVVYALGKNDVISFVHAKSEAAASALYYKIKLDAKKMHPVVSWKWRVEKFPVKKDPESLSSGTEDDFAGRVYVIFPAKFITNWKVLEYIWAETIPVGTKGVSSLSKNIKLIVLRSGRSENGEFVVEERDVVEDYISLFGKPPEYDIGAVAFMTNAEHTGTIADAMYSDVKLGYKEDGVGNKKGGSFEN